MPWAVAAAAVAAGGSYLSAKEANKASRQSGDPVYVENAKKSALERAERIADREYTPYTGQRVAGPTRNERQASGLALTGYDASRSHLDRASGELGKIEDFSGESVNRYMNPYLESVLQPQIREANRQYDRNRSSLMNSKAGAWGGDRAAFEASELERTHGDRVTDITGRTYAEGFESARQSFFADQDRHMRAADAWRSVGGDMARLNREQVQDLMATGGIERMLQQADLDFDYQQFVENRDWDVTNLQPLLDSIAASKGGQMQERGPRASPWGQALGAAATIAGAYFTGGSNIDSGWGSGANANQALADAGYGG